MKLFVWHDSLEKEYGTGVMFALAENVEEARRLILEQGDTFDRKALHGRWRSWSDQLRADVAKEPTVYDAPVGFAVWGGYA